MAIFAVKIAQKCILRGHMKETLHCPGISGKLIIGSLQHKCKLFPMWYFLLSYGSFY